MGDTISERNSNSKVDALVDALEQMTTFLKNNNIRNQSIKLPEKLMYILNECSNTYSEILRWSKDGKSIIIKNPQAFEETITPRFFKKKCSFDSFTRKARRWGFSTKRMLSKDELSDKKYSKMWIFHNPNFNKEAGLKGCQKLNSNTARKDPRKEKTRIQQMKEIYLNESTGPHDSFYSAPLQQRAHLEQQRIRFNLEMAKQSDVLHYLREKRLRTQKRLHQMTITIAKQSFISREEERIRNMHISYDYHSQIIMQKAITAANVTNTNGIPGGSSLQKMFNRSSAFPMKDNGSKRLNYCQEYGAHSK
ncbi:hypothetical protein CTEN210_12579 [Chaetoceros tenuissimus]|uniref:HSF-type DNA-binding domain-containing protein n=1 Tax=Chaetoceros tenuissimus TaxID=426638 RepID=A0AAD3HAM2_9STRA|nr:hypothetical protein CTEN210_12579 [Chaetoceros tenuissimus]